MVPLSLELHVALQEEVKATYRKKNPGLLKVTPNQVALYFDIRHTPRLAEATIHRFFNCAAPTQPGSNTLKILAQYAGFDDLADFVRHFEEQNEMLLRGGRPERLGQAYGLMQRLRGETGAALASSLRAAATSVRTPSGQDDWVQAWVDLAHLPGYFGQLLEIYSEANRSSEAQIFAAGLRYLRGLLTEDLTERDSQAQLLQSLHPRLSAPPFVLGRWAFVRLMERSFEDSSLLSEAELAVLREQAPVPAIAVAASTRPAAYNYFPAGYHFLVAEALYLSQQWPALASWLVETEAALTRIGFQAYGNVYSEVLGAWQAMALYQIGQTTAARATWESLQPSLNKPENRWLWDFYEVYFWLTGQAFAQSPAEAAGLRERVASFAAERGLPYFKQLQ